MLQGRSSYAGPCSTARAQEVICTSLATGFDFTVSGINQKVAMNLRRWLSLPVAVLLACQSAAAVRYANTTSADDDSTTTIRVTSTKFITEFTTSRASSTSEAAAVITTAGQQIMDAQWLQYVSYTWIKKYNATTVGTVQIIVNEATNKTTTTTKYHTELRSNGTGTDSLALLSRTDIDAAGTVTQVVPDLYNASMTITYPTHYVQYSDSMSFYGLGPTSVQGQATCCAGTYFTSATPSHGPFPSPTFTTDTADPSGWLYVAFTGYDQDIPIRNAGSTEITSLWGGSAIHMTVPACGYTTCTFTDMTALPASWAIQQVGILATETTTLSIPDSSPSATPSTRTADPVTALPDNSPLNTGSALAETQVSPETPAGNSPSQQSTSGETSTASSEQQTSGPNLPQHTPSQTNQASPSPSPSFSFSPETTQSPVPPAIIIGQSTFTQQSDSQFVVGSQTVGLGSSITVGSGSSSTIIALQTNGAGDTVVVVGSSSSLLQPQITPASATGRVPAPALVIGSSTIAQQSDSAFIVDGQTLAPGGSITVGSGSSTTVVALASDGNSAVLQDGSSSVVIPVTPAPTVPPDASPVIVVGGSTVTRQSGSVFVVGDETLTPGGSLTLGSGSSTTIVALASNGDSIVLQHGSSSEVRPVVTPAPSGSSSSPAPFLVVGDSTITAQSGSSFVISGQTLIPGGTITITSGSAAQTIALETTGSGLVAVYDGTSSSPLIPAAATITPDPDLPAFTFDGSLISADSASAYVVGGQTLSPGDAIVVSGARITLASDASELVVGTSTVDLRRPSTAGGGVGGYVWSALDVETTPTTTTTTTTREAGRTSDTSSPGGSRGETSIATSAAGTPATPATTTSVARREVVGFWGGWLMSVVFLWLVIWLVGI